MGKKPTGRAPLDGTTARLLRMLDRHGAAALDAALAEALGHGSPTAASVAACGPEGCG
ncbi:hypothetical protein ACMHYB_00945 [Sorangium sp. So ce1128]